MQRAWRLLKQLRPFLSTAPCSSHCGNVLLKEIAKIPVIKTMLEEALKFNEQWTGPHHQRALLKKHPLEHFGRELSALRSCDSRFGLNFLAVAKMLLLQPAFKSAVADVAWDAKLSDDMDAKVAKALATDAQWWADTSQLLYAVWPMAKMVKFGGFQKPSMSHLYAHMLEAEAHWNKLMHDEEFKFAFVAEEVLQIIQSDYVDFDDAGPENRWTMMKSDMALAGYVLDPLYHDKQPWTDPDAMAAFRRVAELQLGIDRATGEYDEKLVNEKMPRFMDQFARYQAKLGQLSKAYVWASLGEMHACSWYQQYCGEFPELQFVGTMVTGCVAGADMAETNWKLYKSINTKARNRLGKVQSNAFTADDGDFDQTTGTKLAYVAANLHVGAYDDYCESDTRKTLAAFTISDEAELIKLFGPIVSGNVLQLGTTYYKNFLEEWEKDTKKKNDNLYARLRDKYLKMILREAPEDADDDESDDDDGPAPELYHGIVIEIEFKKKKDGAYQKGYYVKTAHILTDGGTEATLMGTRIYPVNESLVGLILAEDNPLYTFRG